EFGRTPAGQWYPSRWRETRTTISLGGQEDVAVTEDRVGGYPGMGVGGGGFVAEKGGGGGTLVYGPCSSSKYQSNLKRPKAQNIGFEATIFVIRYSIIGI